VNEPVLIARPNDGTIGPKHGTLCVLLMAIIDMLDEKIYTFKWNNKLDAAINYSLSFVV
jgi:hypothetical protein